MKGGRNEKIQKAGQSPQSRVDQDKESFCDSSGKEKLLEDFNQVWQQRSLSVGKKTIKLDFQFTL